MLERDTGWRQGDLLTHECAAALGLIGAADDGRRVIVITHDCDLPNEAESFVEVIVARWSSRTPSQTRNSHTPRTRADFT
jgi:hypothetical protein